MKKIHVAVYFLAVAILTSSCSLIRPVGEKEKVDVPHTTDPAVTEDAVAESDTAASVEPEEKRVVSFLGCGDNIVYYGNVREAAAVAVPGGRQYNFAPTYTFVADRIRSADVAFINQETLMAGDGYEFSYYPTFNGPQDMGHDLVELGFDVIGMANNHMLDKGGAGLSATMDFWDGCGVLPVGAYRNEADYAEPRILEREGVRIAFLGYTEHTNGITLGASYELAIPYLEEDTLRTQIARAKEAADLVIVSVHWGDEYTFKPNANQKNYAQVMAEAGADVIIGHHPHVIQPVEWLTAQDGTRTLCVYSLGNFIGEQANDYNMVGGMISFDMVKEGKAAYVENVVFTPTVYYFNSSFYSNCVYLMKDFTPALASSHGISAYGKYTSLEKLRGYVSSTIAEEFLPKEW